MLLCYAGYIGLSQTDKLNKDMPCFTQKRNGIKNDCVWHKDNEDSFFGLKDFLLLFVQLLIST